MTNDFLWLNLFLVCTFLKISGTKKKKKIPKYASGAATDDIHGFIVAYIPYSYLDFMQL